MKPAIIRKILFATGCAWAMVGEPVSAADYPTTVSGLGPVAYYRLNETTPVPPANVATNSGTLGVAATGYYLSGAEHPVTGALVATPDGAALFPDAGGNRIKIPWISSLAGTGPFTVEFWASPGALTSGDSSTMCPIAFTQFGDPPGNGSFRSGWLFYQNGGGGWTFRLYGTGNTAYNATVNQTVVVGNWYHVVGVYDGANVTLYVNGQNVATVAAALAHAPVSNPIIPMSIGARADGQLGFFRYNGSVDEVAYYTNALSAATILAHYQNGISASPAQPYNQLVLSLNPAAYYRLNEPFYSTDPSTYPVAANIGSLGAAVSGTYQPGLMTGSAGPAANGLGAGNLACAFSGVTGYIDCTANTTFDFTGPFTVMAWVKVNAWDTDWQSIVTKGDNAWRVHRAGATSALGFGTTALSNVDQVGSRALNDGQWHHIVAVYDGSAKSLYIDGLLDSTVPATGALGVNTYSVLIGDNAQAPGRFFNGSMDEVSIFDKALTQQQVSDVFFSANPPPILVQQPQAPAGQIIAGAPVTLTVIAAGSPTLTYQWRKNGADIAGQTNPSLTFPNITTNDSGNYLVVVTNNFGAVTSSVAALTVAYPTEPASLVRAVGYPLYDPVTRQATLTQVILEFSGPLAAEGANPTHYAITDGTPLTVSNARFTNLNMTVVLTTSPQVQGALYNVTITGVTDGVGNALANNTAQFRAWVDSPLNGITFEYYPSEATASPAYVYTDVGALTNNSLYPDYPVMTTNLWAFDSRIVFPTDAIERYGARMRGVFVPPVSGNYRFYLRSDDASQVFLNPSGSDPAGRQLILNEAGCCGDWNKFASPAFPLVFGQSYYIEMLYKEGGGGDYGKVAALLEPSATVTNYPPLGTANNVVDPASIAGPMIGYPYAPYEAAGPLTLIGPENATVQANHAVTFSVAASNTGGWPMAYQWLRNGAVISGATDQTYTFIAAAGDNGARYWVRVSRLGSVVTSSQATLTVQADTDAPSVAIVRGTTVLNTFVVSFSQRMGTPSPGSFSISGYTATTATLDGTGTNVVVTLDRPLTPGETYTLTVQNVQDASGTTLANASVPLRAFFLSRGLLRFDYFGGLSDTVNDIGQLTTDPRYPGSPDWTGFVAGFDSRSIFPDDSHSGYGAKISGWFLPPTTTNYIFYMKSDDSSQLSINSLGADPSAPAMVAEETTCCRGFADVASMALSMNAGQIYYMEGIYKEGNGGDYLQVTSKPELDPTEPNNLRPMAVNLVGYLADPVGASVTITRQPASQQLVYNIAPLPTTVIDTTFNTSDGGFTVTNYNGNNPPPGPWSYDAASGSWSSFGEDPCNGPYASGLNAPVFTIANDGAVMLTLVHRYSFEGGNWDMGQVRVSVNGGPFATVPALNFSENGYVGAAVGTITPSVAATPGWVNIGWLNQSAGYANREFLTSTAYIGSYRPGDRVQIQLLANWDDCSQGTAPNWEIDSVRVTVGGSLPMVANLSVSAESIYQNEPSAYMSYFWQRNNGPGGAFIDIPGAVSSPNLAQTIAFSESGAQFRCIVYGLGAAATSAVSTVTVTMPIVYARPSANTIALTWPLPPPPAPLTTFVLEQAPAITGAWTVVPSSSYQTTANTVSVTVSVQPGVNQFYRLRRQ